MNAYAMYVGVVVGFRVVKKPALDCRDLKLSLKKAKQTYLRFFYSVIFPGCFWDRS
jgi:hypothetical protein